MRDFVIEVSHGDKGVFVSIVERGGNITTRKFEKEEDAIEYIIEYFVGDAQ